MSNQTVIASVVEGHGERSALPALVRRIAADVFGRYDIETPSPHRIRRNQMTLHGTVGQVLTNAVRVQSARVEEVGGVLVVADADDDCAIDLAQTLSASAGPVKVEIAIAVREFEAWYLASIESLRKHRAVRDDATYDGDPEVPRDAKGVLAARMTEPYRETLHQVAFATMLDPSLAMRSRSFTHLVTCIGRLLGDS